MKPIKKQRKKITIKKILLKKNEVLEIKPPVGHSIFYRFTMQPLSKISRLDVHCESNVFGE